MATTDITVIGAGIFGLSIAYACAQHGAHVHVIENRGIAAGSSGGPVGALAPHTPENWNAKKQFQLDSLLAAPAFWVDVETVSGWPSGYGQTGRLQSLDTERAVQLATDREKSAAALWPADMSWQVIRSPAGWAPASSTGRLVRDTLSARLDPKRACKSLALAIEKLGGKITIGHGTPRGQVIWATGADGLADLSRSLGAPIGNGVKGQALLLRHDAGPGAPQLYADGLHIVPHDNGTVGIGSTSEREFNHPTRTDHKIEDIYRRAVAICPDLSEAEVIARWAGVRPRAKSRAPMLGPYPEKPGHFIANGGFKIGFGMAPKIAQVMADLVLDGVDTIPNGFRVADSL